MYIFLLCILFILFAAIVLYIVKHQSRIPVGEPGAQVFGLLLIAHPDDETMFFAPTILKVTNNLFKLIYLKLLRQRCQIYVLCLSTGNAEGLGEKRKYELTKALQTLGLKNVATHCEVLNDFLDGPNNHWDENKIVEIIKNYIKKWRIKFLITFDYKGVSGHPNHIACFKAAILLTKSELRNTIKVIINFILFS